MKLNYIKQKKKKRKKKREVEPARIRPEWYEAFLREPERAAILITDGAIIVICSVVLFFLGEIVLLLKFSNKDRKAWSPVQKFGLCESSYHDVL